VFGGTGPLEFVGGNDGVATVVATSGGTELITVGGGGLMFGGAGDISTITSGVGASTIFGGSGSIVNFVGNLSGGTFIASDGSETLNASGSSTSNFFAGGAASSNVSLIGGSGTDTMLAGAGTETMAGGGGADAFVFFSANTTGQTVFITDFADTADSMYILGYDSTQSAASLRDNAIVGPNGVTITLSDSTSITFTDLTNANQLDGRILYG